MAKANRTMTGVKEDLVYTPEHIALDVVNHFCPLGKCLEPCCGEGVFLNYLPVETEWCEIQRGRDFFEWSQKVAWIVTNPPYSIFDAFLEKAMEVSDSIVFLIPVGKIMTSMVKLRKIYQWGGISHIRYYGSGRSIGFPFGFPVAAVHIKKDYTGNQSISFYKKDRGIVAG